MCELTLSCGAKYVGGVKNGNMFGKGFVITPMMLDSSQMYVGELNDGKPCGQGKITYKNQFSFEGQFRYGWAQYGIVRDSLNCVLNGFIENVEYYSKKGEKYSGDYLNGKRNGFGCIIYTDGRRWEGNFISDVWTGVFLYTDENNQQFEQSWVNDSRIYQEPAGFVQLQAANARREEAETLREEKRLLKEMNQVKMQSMHLKKSNNAIRKIVLGKVQGVLKVQFNRFVMNCLLMLEVAM